MPRQANSGPQKINDEPSHDNSVLGRIFGQGQEGVIRGAVSIGIIALIGFIAIGGWSSSQHAPDVLKGLSAIVLAALTFLGGISSGQRRR